MKTIWWLVEHPQNASRQTVWPRLNKKSEYMCHALKSTTCYYLINLPEFVCIHYIYIYTNIFATLHLLKLKSRKKTLLHLELSGKASLSCQCKSHQRRNERHNSFPPSRIGEGPERKHLIPTCQTGVPCLIGSTPCCWWRGCFLGTI